VTFLAKSTRIILIGSIFFLVILISIFVILYEQKSIIKPEIKKEESKMKLYWFIPDGMRADPETFNIYEWANEGKLSNIKKMMDNGAYGYAIPDFPSHTPANFASLLTGSHPIVHGVADGPMHIEGFPLDKPSVAGFSSVAKKVSPIWKIFEENNKKVVLLSIPGSTPPELEKGITIRGRWGGWGLDTYNIVYEPKDKLPERKAAGRGFKLFYLGSPLTKFVDKYNATNWKIEAKSFSKPLESKLDAYGLNIYIYISDSQNDNKVNYDNIYFSLDKSNLIAHLKEGIWSEWIPVKLNFKEILFNSSVKIKIIRLEDNGNYRIRILYNNLNKFITDPDYIADDLTESVGPMVDFADNWPPQLIYEQEDKDTFFEEAKMSMEWHRDAVSVIYDKYKPDIFLQDIYTPNQMLESRWWHQYIDKERANYSEDKAQKAWSDILELYKGLDAILGEAIKNADENTFIVLSSDHGICPLRRLVKLNNLFAKKGWLKFKVNDDTREPEIDWNNTKVIFLKMAHVYVNPNGLGGNWKRGSGPEYESLREQVIQELMSLQDQNGSKPVVNAIKWEDAPKFFELPTDRIGDVVLEAKMSYAWFEEVDNSLKIFDNPITSGYKQTIDGKRNKCMWTPFIIMGPGVKKGFEINGSINLIDEMPTILSLMNITIPKYVQGQVKTAIFE